MAKELMIKQAQAQAIYMNELAKLAKVKVEQNHDNLSFDPQSRVLVQITPTQEEISAIVRKINKISKYPFSLTKQGLDKALGKLKIPITPTTTVSLDVSNNKVLITQYNKKLSKALSTAGVENPEAILDKLKETPKGSIIALQQEFDFHLNLVSRVYQKSVPALTKEKMEAVHQAAMTEVNKLVMKIYAEALKGAMKDGNLDVAKLNKSLDKARKDLLPQIHSIMMQQIVQKTGVILSKKELQKVSLKHIAEGTTATPNDVLHLDQSQNIATLIAGSENTAHDRIQGGQLAHKQLITQNLSKSGKVTTNKHTRIQIRTPSPVLKVGLPNDNAYINDVATKLNAIKQEYNLTALLSGSEHKPRAFIYNSYTAINDGQDDFLGNIDINENLQTQSADHIIRGMHRYNVKQLRDLNQQPPVFCLVQNISVNGFGDSLGYDSGNTLKEESTLMGEIALLHTLYDKATSEEQEQIGEVFKKYNKYLQRSPHRESYFSSSEQGKEAKQLIQELKQAWKGQPNPGSENFLDNVRLGLKNLMAHNLHFQHDYAKLAQVLSVYAEEASIGGCKSGNERAQAINGRVALLDSLANEKKSEGMKQIKEALNDLAKGGAGVPIVVKRLKAALDSEYNKVGLQSAASIVSLVDQGASAKVEAKEGAVGSFTSRNYAEEQSSVMTNLHQGKAGKMQAHKDLSKMMVNAWKGHPLKFWDRMKSSPLGTVGALIGIAIFPIAIGVALYNKYDNAQRQAKTLETNETLKTEIYDRAHPKDKANDSGNTHHMLESLSNIPKDTSKKNGEPTPGKQQPAPKTSTISLLVQHMQTTQPIISQPKTAPHQVSEIDEHPTGTNFTPGS